MVVHAKRGYTVRSESERQLVITGPVTLTELIRSVTRLRWRLADEEGNPVAAF